MRQLVCMPADIYCQITKNFYLRNIIILYLSGKKGKRLAARETERECVRDGEWLKMELPSVVKRPLGEGLTYFRIYREPNIRIMFSRVTISKDTLRFQR